MSKNKKSDDYFNFGKKDKIANTQKFKIPQVVDDLPNFEKINKDVERQRRQISKKNTDYYEIYKDFDESKNKGKDIIYKLEKAPFVFLNEHPSKYYQRFNNVKQCEDYGCKDADDAELVREAYFLPENLDIIQNTIIRHIAKKTNYIISRQKDDDILQLMNGIYHDYAKHLPYNLAEQVKELNDRTINFVTPYLIKEIEFYQRFLIDSNTPLRPPELPISSTKLRQESLPPMFPR
jgi:hypothetical protein